MLLACCEEGIKYTVLELSFNFHLRCFAHPFFPFALKPLTPLQPLPLHIFFRSHFRGAKVSEVTFKKVDLKLHPYITLELLFCAFLYWTLGLHPFLSLSFPLVLHSALCWMAVCGWQCFNFWPYCKVLFFSQSYCSHGSSGYLTRPTATLHTERKSFRL